MKTANEMRLKTIRAKEKIKRIQEKENREELSIAILGLNERIKTAAKQGRYFAETHIGSLNTTQREFLQKYYIELGYSVNIQQFYWITISWENNNE